MATTDFSWWDNSVRQIPILKTHCFSVGYLVTTRTLAWTPGVSIIYFPDFCCSILYLYWFFKLLENITYSDGFHGCIRKLTMGKKPRRKKDLDVTQLEAHGDVNRESCPLFWFFNCAVFTLFQRQFFIFLMVFIRFCPNFIPLFAVIICFSLCLLFFISIQ